MTFGEKLLELRRKHAMSQDVLAEKLEVSRQAVSKWERDEAMPETDKVVRIAQLFGVSLDYLLTDQPREEPRTAQTPPPRQGQPQSAYARRAEQLIRRHGYKAGYVPIAAGSFLCLIALLVMLLLPNFGSGMFDAAGSMGDSWNNGIYVEGDIPHEVLDAIYDQAGAGMYPGGGVFDSMFDQYQQGVDQMERGWRSSVTVVAAMFGIPVFLFGGILIALGIYLVIKGKRYATQSGQS